MMGESARTARPILSSWTCRVDHSPPGAIINAIAHSNQRPQGIIMPINIRQLTRVFGAEISSIDLTRPLDDATFAAVENAFETYSVLVFPRQNLDDESQIAFSSRFGALETTQ
jgi:hypothetical protein